MIWQAPAPEAEPQRAALRKHILQVLREVVPPVRHEPLFADLSDATAVLLLHGTPHTLFSDDEIRLALAQVLTLVKRDDLVHAVLMARDGCVSLEAYVPVLAEKAVAPDLWQICAAGALRPVRDLLQQDGPGWVLDLERATRAGGTLEMATQGVLKGLLDRIVPLWDHSDGRGACGLRVESTEWLALCRALLERERHRRGWESVPAVFRAARPIPADPALTS